MKKIFIYGDSNVWGDNFIEGVRIPFDKQWPNILQCKLGSDYLVYQEGLPGRVAGSLESVKKYKNGRDSFLATFRCKAPVTVCCNYLFSFDRISTSQVQDFFARGCDYLVYHSVFHSQ